MPGQVATDLWEKEGYLLQSTLQVVVGFAGMLVVSFLQQLVVGFAGMLVVSFLQQLVVGFAYMLVVSFLQQLVVSFLQQLVGCFRMREWEEGSLLKLGEESSLLRAWAGSLFCLCSWLGSCRKSFDRSSH